jgi:hypothetical protein
VHRYLSGSRISYGGTAPRNVRREAKRWLQRLSKKMAAQADAQDASTNIKAAALNCGRAALMVCYHSGGE